MSGSVRMVRTFIVALVLTYALVAIPHANAAQPTLDVVSLTANLPLPSPYNKVVAWTATATPSTGVEYSFWRFDASVGWTEVQPYSANPTYVWIPAYEDVGYHALQVWARLAGSTAAYESYAATEFFITSPLPQVTALLPHFSVYPIAAGRATLWNATVVGGLAPLCQFWRRDADGWHMVQDYGECSYAWTPRVEDIGPHALQVWARNAGSTARYESYTAVVFDVREPDPLVAFNHATFSRPVGRPIVYEAAAAGGVAPLQYRFWRLVAGVWTIVQDYGTSKQYTWTPTVSDVGLQTFRVWVRSNGSTAEYDASAEAVYDITPPAPLRIETIQHQLSPTGAILSGGDVAISSLIVNVPMKWRAVVAGGIAPVEYRFWRLDSAGWSIVQDYSTADSYTWTPTLTDVGPHALQVWVRSAGSTAPYDDWKGETFTVDVSPILVSQITSSSLPVSTGTTITWSAAVLGGQPPFEYQFWRYDAAGWHVVQPYGPSSAYTWTPAAQDVGAHAVQVWIRSAGSTRSFDAWTTTGYFAVLPGP